MSSPRYVVYKSEYTSTLHYNVNNTFDRPNAWFITGNACKFVITMRR